MNTRDKETGRFIKNQGDGNGAVLHRRMLDVVENAMYSRQQFTQKLLDPRRNIDDECGYPSTDSLSIENYRQLYNREPIAARVVQVLPQESWAMQPTVYEDEDAEAVTEFEKAWDILDKNLHKRSWYQDEEGSPIWEALRRVDELSGIGSYGVLLLGLDDGLPLNEPVAGVEEENSTPMEVGGKTSPTINGVYRMTTNAEQIKGRKLLYLRAFDESLATITRYEVNSTSPRYGHPVEYSITLGGKQYGGEVTKVHWTRLIHMADNIGCSEVFGVPRMQTVFNRLFDLRKLYSGSAEMYWHGAFPGFAIESHPQYGDIEWPADLKDQLEKHMTGLQRYIALAGVTIKSLAPQVVDPTPQIDTQIEAICIQLDIPKRVFTGSERGELASSQDKRKWNGRLRRRQLGYLTPRIIVPFVDRLILIGALPEPQGYSVRWPDLDAMTQEEQAGIAVKRTEAFAKYVQGSVEALIGPMDYLTRIHDMTEEEAREVLEAAVEVVEEEPKTEGGGEE